MLTHYMVPQENGNRTDVDWWRMQDKTRQKGLEVNGKNGLSMSVWPWSQQVLDSALHSYDLRGFFTLNIDLAQSGVGGTDSWTSLGAPMDIYKVQPGQYQYQFMLRPIN